MTLSFPPAVGGNPITLSEENVNGQPGCPTKAFGHDRVVNGLGIRSNNRTIDLSADEMDFYQRNLVRLTGPVAIAEVENKTINQNLFEILEWLPGGWIDLLFIDPLYNSERLIHFYLLLN